MKILQICNKAPYPPNDGSSIAIYNMSLGLISQNIDLHIFTLNTNRVIMLFLVVSLDATTDKIPLY